MTSLTAGYYSPIGKNDECVYRPRASFEWFGSSNQPVKQHTFMTDKEYYKSRAEIPNDSIRHFNHIVESEYSVIDK